LHRNSPDLQDESEERENAEIKSVYNVIQFVAPNRNLKKLNATSCPHYSVGSIETFSREK